MYVLSPWSSAEIAGWRKNLNEVAAFYFTNLSDSYAGRTGRPLNVGVIGVAVYEEDLPVISRLLEADAKSLDRLQIQMATAREFFVLVRLREETGMELHTHLSRIQKSLEDQGFKASLASGEDLKRMLGVYFEQNATTEKYEDYDGERWIILND